jgi:ATP-dependent protease HslVU (ClpYQ) peptidase subunit
VTTIATDGKTMAGDGQAEACRTIISLSRQKVTRLPDGSLCGCAGSGVDAIAFAKWLADGGPRPKFKDSMSALHLKADGSLDYYSERGEPSPVEAPCAVGSGMDFAIGAMLFGAAPEEAVAIASQRDPGTGGKITALSL